jgi:hypothetical protein
MEVVESESLSIASEGVSEDDVGTGSHIGTMDVADTVRMVKVPELGGIARGQAGIEQLRAHGTVKDQVPLGVEEVPEDSHGMNLSVNPRANTCQCQSTRFRPDTARGVPSSLLIGHCLATGADKGWLLGSDLAYVEGFRAFAALTYFELNRLAFVEAPVAGTVDVGVVDEHVLSTFNIDETVTLFGVEKLNCAGRHDNHIRFR